MTSELPIYEHCLGDELFLKAYSLDPKISQADLKKIVSFRDGSSKLDLEVIANHISLIAKLDSFGGLEINVSDEVYKVPEQLQPYREALDEELVEKGMFNGSVMVVTRDEGIPLKIYRGGFFDFKATQLTAVPSKLLPNIYDHNKTIKQLLPEWGLDKSQMARYLGFAFIMLPSNGEEISFVQRAKELGIAEDVMALSGCTPHWRGMETVLEDVLKDNRFYRTIFNLIPKKLTSGFLRRTFGQNSRFPYGFYDPFFDFEKYFEATIKKQIKKEYNLLPDEFTIGKCYLMDDKRWVPFVAIEIKTQLSTKDIAKRIYGIAEEHNILYSISPRAVGTLIDRFPLLDSTAYVMSLVAKEKN